MLSRPVISVVVTSSDPGGESVEGWGSSTDLGRLFSLLEEKEHTISVIGKNKDGYWLSESESIRYSWTIQRNPFYATA